MQYSRKRFAAIALVVMLGLLMPSTFGGPALADVKPPPNGGKTPPNDHARNPLYVETVFHCDLDDDGIYEVPYEAVTTHQDVWQDKNSPTVILKRHNVDTIYSSYEVINDPTETAENFDDPDVYWSEGPYYDPDLSPKGWKTVLCTADFSYGYSPFPSESTPEFNEEHGLSFVQTDECEVFGFVEDPSEVDDCVTYLETDTELFEVTISGDKGAKAKSASADDAPSADRAVKAKKNGKHRGKGKRRG